MSPDIGGDIKSEFDMRLYVQEEYVNVDRDVRYEGTGTPYESAYETTEIGGLYRALVREYGRCTGRVYLDTQSRGTVAVGWVFLKRERYDGSDDDTYLQETWVSVFEPCGEDDPLMLRRRDEPLNIKYKYMEA